MSTPQVGKTTAATTTAQSFAPTKANIEKFEQQQKISNFMTQGAQKAENKSALTREEYIKDYNARQNAKKTNVLADVGTKMAKGGAAMAKGAAILLGGLFQSCSSINDHLDIEANQKLDVTVRPVYVGGDTVYVEVPKKYHPEVNDSLVNRYTELGFDIQGEGDLLGLITGKVDWEYNADMKAPIDVSQSSDKEMVFKNTKIKMDGQEFYGRLRHSLTNPVPGEGKRILIEVEHPIDKPKQEPTDNTTWDSFGKYIIGKVENGKATIYDRNNIDTLGYMTKEANWEDPTKSDLVFHMRNGKLTGISDFKLHKVNPDK